MSLSSRGSVSHLWQERILKQTIVQYSGSENSKKVVTQADQILLYIKPLTHMMEPLKPLLKRNPSVWC